MILLPFVEKVLLKVVDSEVNRNKSPGNIMDDQLDRQQIFMRAIR
jgi:hypothetical protein